MKRTFAEAMAHRRCYTLSLHDALPISKTIPGADRLMYAYGEEAKAFSASSRDSNDLYFAPS